MKIFDIQPMDNYQQILQNLLRQGLGVIRELWSYTGDDWATSVHAGEIDGDGDCEIAVGFRNGEVHILTREGYLKWRYLAEPSTWIGDLFCVENVNALDRTRVVAGMRNGKTVGLTEEGKHLWTFSAEEVIRCVRVADIDQDGKAEVLLGSEDLSIYALKCETGEVRWRYRTNGWIRSLYPFDVDGDGRIEILAASGDKHIYILDPDGRLKKKHYVGSKVHVLHVTDLDDDGQLEILIGSDAKDLSVMTTDGTIKWRFQPANRIHSINVKDLNGDGYAEIIAGSEDGHIYFLDCQGNLLWQHFLGQRIFSICTVDLNRDGIQEILVGLEDNNIWVLAVELSANLLSTIRETHRLLGSPAASSLRFSETERALLRTLVNQLEPEERQMTLPGIEDALTTSDHFAALAILLRLRRQPVQPLWMRTDLGHLRVVKITTHSDRREKKLVVATDEGDVIGLTTSGQTLHTISVGERIRSLDVADIDADEKDEALVGTAGGYVYVLDASTLEEKLHSSFSNDWIESIAVTHPVGTKLCEIVLGTRLRKEIQFCYGDFSSASYAFSLPQGVQILSAYDIDDDGIDEILAGVLEDGVYAYTREGQHLWTYHTKDRVRAILVCDIDHDGQLEILVGSEGRYIHVLDCHGHIQWHYYIQHRVLALAVSGSDRDKSIEILAGLGNGQLCALNSRGDVCWRFQANDRIRSILAEDIDGDGLTEIVIGTEDHLYMLRLLDQSQLDAVIETRWHALQTGSSQEELLKQMACHNDPNLRAFVFNRLASNGFSRLLKHVLQLDYIQALYYDSAIEVKKAFIEFIPLLSQLNSQESPEEIRRILDTLSSDRSREVRMVLIDGFAALCQSNPQLGFEYLERFTRNPDLWVRYGILHQLDRLIPAFPESVFPLLMQILRRSKEFWICQESASVMAHYLDAHTSYLLRAIRSLIVQNFDLSLLEVLMYCARTPLVRNVFRAFIALSENLSEENVLARLEQVVTVLDGKVHLLARGEVILQLYYELRQLHRIRTLEEMAQYQWVPQTWQVSREAIDWGGEEAYFTPTFQALSQLNTITETLRIYLRRDGLGERISSLLDAEQAIEQLTTDMNAVYYKDCPALFPDRVILRLLLLHWRRMVHTELSLIRGRADLRPELVMQQMVHEETVVVPLRIQNVGRSPADNVLVVLQPAQDGSFTIAGPDQQSFTTISASSPLTAEFTIKPRQTSFRLAFQITYDDAEGKGKTRAFGERLDLVSRPRNVRQLHNPYYTGTAVQKLSMFYGREREISLLQQDFVYSSAPAVVVLYGQRRSGKSSLIYKLLLSNLLDPHIPVRIDMQHETLNFSTEKFLRNVAYAVHRQLQKRGYSEPFPDLAVFKEDAVFAFDRFLDGVEEWLEERKLVLLIDEFEVLDDKAVSDQIDQHLFEHLRSLVQERQCMHLLLAGTHKLQDLTSAYWSIFFNLANHRRLSNLTVEAARQLICEPMSGLLEYDPFAVEKIRMLTGDQPYLIQLFCHYLVRHCANHGKDYITTNDVNVVQEEVKQSGRLYFNWIWDQASPEERVILSIIAQASGDSEQFVSFNDIERIFRDYHLSYTRESLLASLRNLRNGDVIIDVPHEHRYKIVVGLTRAWLHESKPIQRVVHGQE